jgi:putative chitinase
MEQIVIQPLSAKPALSAAGIFAAVAPQAKPNYLNAFHCGTASPEQFDITTPLRISHFLAQILHETGGGTLLWENLTYTKVARILAIFGVGRHSAAVRPNEAPGLVRNPQALAERVYGLGNPRMARALGNTKPGDGYRYRGGGMLQTTGGANYRKMGALAGADFYGKPDLIVTPEHALQPALHLWARADLNAAADKNDIRTITKAINGGMIGLAQRQAWFEKVWPLASGGMALPDAAGAAAPIA